MAKRNWRRRRPSLCEDRIGVLHSLIGATCYLNGRFEQVSRLPRGSSPTARQDRLSIPYETQALPRHSDHRLLAKMPAAIEIPHAAILCRTSSFPSKAHDLFTLHNLDQHCRIE